VGERPSDEFRSALMLLRKLVQADTSRTEMRALLQDRFPRQGPWTAQRLSDLIRLLRRRRPGPERLPLELPETKRRAEILKRIAKGRRARQAWATVARELQRDGLRPPRGAVFSANQVRLLHLRSNGKAN